MDAPTSNTTFSVLPDEGAVAPVSGDVARFSTPGPQPELEGIVTTDFMTIAFTQWVYLKQITWDTDMGVGTVIASVNINYGLLGGFGRLIYDCYERSKLSYRLQVILNASFQHHGQVGVMLMPPTAPADLTLAERSVYGMDLINALTQKFEVPLADVFHGAETLKHNSTSSRAWRVEFVVFSPLGIATTGNTESVSMTLQVMLNPESIFVSPTTRFLYDDTRSVLTSNMYPANLLVKDHLQMLVFKKVVVGNAFTFIRGNTHLQTKIGGEPLYVNPPESAHQYLKDFALRRFTYQHYTADFASTYVTASSPGHLNTKTFLKGLNGDQAGARVFSYGVTNISILGLVAAMHLDKEVNFKDFDPYAKRHDQQGAWLGYNAITGVTYDIAMQGDYLSEVHMIVSSGSDTINPDLGFDNGTRAQVVLKFGEMMITPGLYYNEAYPNAPAWTQMLCEREPPPSGFDYYFWVIIRGIVYMPARLTANGLLTTTATYKDSALEMSEVEFRYQYLINSDRPMPEVASFDIKVELMEERLKTSLVRTSKAIALWGNKYRALDTGRSARLICASCCDVATPIEQSIFLEEAERIIEERRATVTEPSSL